MKELKVVLKVEGFKGKVQFKIKNLLITIKAK